MNWKAFRQPAIWIDVLLALTLFFLAARAHSQQPSDAVERHLEFNDKQLVALTDRFNGLDEKVSELWGAGMLASALATGSVILQIRKK